MTPLPGAESSALVPAGPQSMAISHLMSLFLTVSLIVFVAVTIGLAYAVRRARRNTEPSATADRTATRVVTAAAGLTVVTLFVLLVASVLASRQLSAIERPKALTIEVTAYQWWWNIEYDHPMPSQRITSPNEIHIPVGEPVHIKLASHDVIHSFWVPSLHGKRDVLPGHFSEIWVQADRPGIYRGQCAEFCGHEHARMAFLVIAEPRPKFDAWVANQRSEGHPPGTPEQQRGRELFEASDCALCHRVQGTTAGATAGPDLTHVASRLTLAAATIPNDRAALARWIEAPHHFKPATQMPATALSDDDARALVSYLENLK